MIVSMSRITVLGPRRLRATVVDAVQALGVLHVDDAQAQHEGFAPENLSDEDEAARATANAIRTRADGVLALLPPSDAAAPPTALHAPAPVESVPDRLDAVERSVRALTQRLLEAEEEQEILGAYSGSIQLVAPMLGLFEHSPRLEATGFLVDGRGSGRLGALRAELAGATQGRMVFVTRPAGDHVIGVVVHARRDEEAVRAVLTRAGAGELRLPARVQGKPLSEAVPALASRAASLPGEIEASRHELLEQSRRDRTEVALVASDARDAVERFDLMARLPVSRYVFVLHGWVPTVRVPEVRRGLADGFTPDVLVYDESAPARPPNAVPVLLDNPAWLKPFELFLRIFAPPQYGTFDPTIFFAVGMPLFVGLVIGDIGYGACLLGIALWLREKAATGRPWHIVLRGLDFGFTLTPAVMRSVAAIMGWMTASTFAFGAAFGEVFGDLPERLIPGFHPMFDRLSGLTAYLYLSIGFGMAQVGLGLVLQMIKAVRERTLRGLLEPVAILSGAAAVFVWIATQAGVLPAGPLRPVLLAAIAVLVLTLLCSYTLGSLMWIMESVSTFGNVISYARIFAVGIASLGLAVVANDLGASAPVLVLGILVGVVAHATFFGLTVIGHFLQPARLHWVEFCSQFKYYQDSGRAYRPFRRLGGGNL
jgi:V/A-type H+-transporting ATPase subunit I